MGLKKGWTGEIKLFNQKLEDFKGWQKIGYVPQRVIEFDQKFPITVFETVKLGRMYNFKKFWRNHTKDIKTINDIIEALGISDLKNKLIGELSGGQKQRVMIARALASEPELLLLDEPNTGIDNETQQEFYNILKRLNKEQKITIIFITHDIGVIEDSINSIISINKEILKSDQPRTIFNCQVMREVYGIESHLHYH